MPDRLDPMKKSEVLAYLKREKDPRGMAHWKAHAEASGGLTSYGIGLTRLRKYAKGIGPDAKLAKALWNSKVYEMRVLSLLVDDPKSMTMEQAERQVEELHGGYLSHVFSSCDATLAKTPFVVELLQTWTKSKDPVRRGCGYALLYEVSKWKKKAVPDEAAFLAHIAKIEKSQAKEPVSVRMAMGAALMGMGKRSKTLNAAAIKVCKKMGPIEFDPTGKCEPFDVLKHLMGPQLKKRLGT